MAGSKKTVLKSLALITQLGIMVITPIALCTFLGLFVVRGTGKGWVLIPFIALGAIAGLTSVYRMVMKVVKQDEAEKAANRDPVMDKLMESFNETPYGNSAETKPEDTTKP